MNPRSIPKIGRWVAAAAAIAIVLAVAGIFAHREWLSSRAMKHVPPAVPASVEQRSLQFTFSKVDGQQTVFTIHAAQATKFSGKKSSVLEDVDVVVYGEHGERHDEIHTRSCDYQQSTGQMVCRGKVELSLENAKGVARLGSTAGHIHVVTRGVRFDRETGDAITDAPVKFQFSGGRGEAVGVLYSSRKATVTLERDVDLTLTPNRQGGVPSKVTSKNGLSYNRATGKLLLRGPVNIRKGNRSFRTSTLTVMLNERMRPRVANAGGGVLFAVNGGKRPAQMQAKRAEVLFDRQGRADRVNASGGVVARQRQGSQLEARQASVMLDPADQQPRQVIASGDVQLTSAGKGREGRLRSATLYLTVGTTDRTAERATGAAKGGAYGRVRIEQATAPGRAAGEWKSGKERLSFDAGRFSATFDGENQIRELRGSGGVKVDRLENGKTPVRTTASALQVLFSNGQWIRAEESGGVHAVQGDRRAEAQRASWSRARQVMEFEGNAQVHDPSGQTLADKIFWNQGTGELRASGDVRSTYFPSATGGTGAGPSAGPVNLVARMMEAKPSIGEATYSGGARLWQGGLMIQADRIELRRKSGELTATGGVRGAFPQTGRQSKPGERGTTKGRSTIPVLWRMKADRLTYVNRGGSGKADSGTATLDGGVVATSRDGQIQAQRLALQMRRDALGRAELTQATGDGGVLVRQGKRWGRGERAMYDAEEGKFVLSGARPSLHDTSGDLVTGSELTFYVANDTILVESAKGSRTLTGHPIHKKN